MVDSGVLQNRLVTDFALSRLPKVTSWQCSRDNNSLRRYWRRLLLGRAVTNSNDGQKPLPGELAATLQRATAGTLGAFQALRTALRDHVHSERSRGASLAEIDADLRTMIDDAGDGDGDHLEQHMDELKVLVLRWSEGFYSRKT